MKFLCLLKLATALDQQGPLRSLSNSPSTHPRKMVAEGALVVARSRWQHGKGRALLAGATSCSGCSSTIRRVASCAANDWW